MTRGPWRGWAGGLVLLLVAVVTAASGQDASGVPPRPAFVDAWFGADLPLSDGRFLAIFPARPGSGTRSAADRPGLAPELDRSGEDRSSRSEVRGLPLIEAPGLPTIRVPHPVRRFRKTVSPAGILPIDLRAACREAGLASGTLLLAVEFEAVDLPWIGLAWRSDAGFVALRPCEALFFQAQPRFARRRAWFLLDDFDRMPAATSQEPSGTDASRALGTKPLSGPTLHVVGQAGARVIGIQAWRFGTGAPDEAADAAVQASIQAAFRRLLRRAPTAMELRLARRAMQAGEFPPLQLVRRLAMGDEFQHRFVFASSRTRVIELLHRLFHAAPILPERLVGALGAWRRRGYDEAVEYLLFLEESVLDNPAALDAASGSGRGSDTGSGSTFGRGTEGGFQSNPGTGLGKTGIGQ